MLLALALLLGPWADPKAELEAASAAYDRAVSKADIQVLNKLDRKSTRLNSSH